MLEIRLKQIAFNSFPVVLDEDSFIFQTIWSDRDSTWRLNIMDSSRNLVFSGIALNGTRLLNLEYFYRESPKGLLFCVYDNVNYEDKFSDIGTNLRLYYIPRDEISEVFDL